MRERKGERKGGEGEGREREEPALPIKNCRRAPAIFCFPLYFYRRKLIISVCTSFFIICFLEVNVIRWRNASASVINYVAFPNSKMLHSAMCGLFAMWQATPPAVAAYPFPGVIDRWK